MQKDQQYRLEIDFSKLQDYKIHSEDFRDILQTKLTRYFNTFNPIVEEPFTNTPGKYVYIIRLRKSGRNEWNRDPQDFARWLVHRQLIETRKMFPLTLTIVKNQNRRRR